LILPGDHVQLELLAHLMELSVFKFAHLSSPEHKLIYNQHATQLQYLSIAQHIPHREFQFSLLQLFDQLLMYVPQLNHLPFKLTAHHLEHNVSKLTLLLLLDHKFKYTLHHHQVL
jgi:hypothetical protein